MTRARWLLGSLRGGAALGLAFGLAWVAPGSAQTLTLRVLEDSTHLPLEGVAVRVLSNGRVVAGGLTSAAGRLQLTLPSAGSYDIRANRIGYVGTVPLRVSVPAAGTQREILMPRRVLTLPALEVTGERRCQPNPTGGSVAAALWEEVQAALAANQVTAGQGLEPLWFSRYERVLAPNRVVLEERLLGSGVVRGQPFQSLPPARLDRSGYVFAEGDSTLYAVPDAAALLDDTFVRTHCFFLRAHPDEPNLIGLGFEPVRTRRRADVAGTLWVDRATRELRHLEYGYTGVSGALGMGSPGGQVVYTRRPAGTWIVSDWYVRMPRLGERRTLAGDTGELVFLGWMERGGHARPEPAPVPVPAVLSVVAGMVFDSVHGRPLPGALVFVSGEPDSTRTDEAGTFRLSVNAAGSRLLHVQHDLLALVPDASTQEVVLIRGQTVAARVAVPAVPAFVAAFCPGGVGEAAVIGLMRDPLGRPVEGVSLTAEWTATVSSSGRKTVIRQRRVTTKSLPRGVYAFCDLPANAMALTWSRDGRFLGGTELKLVPTEVRWLDLRDPG